jgi:hypothetical protein
VDYLVDTMIERQRAIAGYAFSQVQPLDNVIAAENATLCFDDLALSYRLREHPVHYTITAYDRAGRAVGSAIRVTAAPSGHTCTAHLALGRGNEQYTIWHVETAGSPGGTFVHVARDPVTSTLRVIGLWRE